MRPFSTDSPWNTAVDTAPSDPGSDRLIGLAEQRLGVTEQLRIPSQVTITTGAYPFAHRVFLFTYRQAVARPEVKAFLGLHPGPCPRHRVAKRLVPITDQQLSDELTLVDGHRPALPAASAPAPAPAGARRTV